MFPFLHSLSLPLLVVLLLSPNPTFSADPPQSSPSPSLHSPQLSPPFPSPAFRHSPPPRSPPVSPSSPPPSDADYDDSYEQNKSPPPVPADSGERDQSHVGDLETGEDSDSGGKKAGIAMGVIAAGCFVAVGAMVYKKRQKNIRRAQYGYVARGEFL